MTTDNTLRAGTRLRGAVEYTIVEPLHSGGFGITYKATAQVMVGHIPQVATFAIKEFFMGKICSRDAHGCVVTGDADRHLFGQAKHDFIDEAQVLHSLRHEGIVPVNEVFEQNGTAYYVMSYLGTTSLYAYVAERGGRLAEEEALAIVRQLASAVAYLHNRHMLHLDIKPENIMMAPAGGGRVTPVLIDFGQTMYFAGGKPKHDKGVGGYSRGYSAPEQKSGVTAFCPQLDIYSVAATLLYMLSGTVPCDAAEQSMQKICKALPDNISQHTAYAIICAMKQDADARPRDMVSFLAMMSGAAVQMDVPGAGGQGTASRKTEIIADDVPQNRSWQIKAALVAACIVVACLAAWLVGRHSMVLTSNDETTAQTEDTTGHALVADNNAAAELMGPYDRVVADGGSPSKSEINVGASGHSTATGEGLHDTIKPSHVSSADLPPHETNHHNEVQTPAHKPLAGRGTVNLGYATWTGGLLGGKPHGSGRMVFRTEHRVGGCSTTPVAGDYIEGFCEQGVLMHGNLYHNGEIVENFVR